MNNKIKLKNNILLISCVIGLFIGVNTSYANNSVTIKNESPCM